MSKNNLKKLAEEYNPPESLKRRVKQKVNSNLGVLRFISNIFDLYIGQASRVVTEMLDTFEKKEEDSKGKWKGLHDKMKERESECAHARERE